MRREETAGKETRKEEGKYFRLLCRLVGWGWMKVMKEGSECYCKESRVMEV